MKYLYIFLILLLFSKSLSAQTKFGILAGLNVSKIYNTEPVWQDITLFKLGVKFGITSKINLTNKLNLDPSISYSQIGTQLDNSKYQIPNTSWNLNYLNSNVILGINIYKKWNINTGPEIGYLLSATQSYSGIKGDMTTLYKNFDFLAVIGISYDATNKASVSFNYNHGFSNISNASFINPTAPEEFYYPGEYNRFFSLSISYFFTNKKQTVSSQS